MLTPFNGLEKVIKSMGKKYQLAEFQQLPGRKKISDMCCEKINVLNTFEIIII